MRSPSTKTRRCSDAPHRRVGSVATTGAHWAGLLQEGEQCVAADREVEGARLMIESEEVAMTDAPRDGAQGAEGEEAKRWDELTRGELIDIFEKGNNNVNLIRCAYRAAAAMLRGDADKARESADKVAACEVMRLPYAKTEELRDLNSDGEVTGYSASVASGKWIPGKGGGIGEYEYYGFANARLPEKALLLANERMNAAIAAAAKLKGMQDSG